MDDDDDDDDERVEDSDQSDGESALDDLIQAHVTSPTIPRLDQPEMSE